MKRYDSYKDSGVKWLGEIPSHWEMLALKHILKNKKEVVGKRSSQYDLLSLTLKGVIIRDMDNPEGKFPASFDTYQIVEPNDFIFCNFDNEETPRAVGLSQYKGMITGAYDVLYRNNPLLSDKYLIYYFLYIDDSKRFKPLYKGLRKTVPFDSFMSYKIPVPSRGEQDAVVEYLDAATSKIDEAIAQQQKMIDLLNERKQIIINNAVTKGLDPNVKMKPSGIDWIGDIPEHWELSQLKKVAKIILGKMLSREQGNVYPYLCAKDVHYGSVDVSDLKSMNFSEIEKQMYEVRNGDMLIVEGGAGAGGCAIFECKGTGIYIQNSIMIVRGNTMMLNGYICYMIQSMNQRGYVEYICNKATIPHFTKEKVGSVIIPIPPKEEQETIVKHVTKRIKPIDDNIIARNKQISLLQERKQIIINDVVTGKVKVV